MNKKAREKLKKENANGLAPEVIELLKGYPINQRIRRFRTLMGFTQAEFAEKVGISAASVINWESGNNAPTGLMLDMITQVYNLPIDFFADVHFANERNKGESNG